MRGSRSYRHSLPRDAAGDGDARTGRHVQRWLRRGHLPLLREAARTGENGGGARAPPWAGIYPLTRLVGTLILFSNTKNHLSNSRAAGRRCFRQRVPREPPVGSQGRGNFPDVGAHAPGICAEKDTPSRVWLGRSSLDRLPRCRAPQQANRGKGEEACVHFTVHDFSRDNRCPYLRRYCLA